MPRRDRFHGFLTEKGHDWVRTSESQEGTAHDDGSNANSNEDSRQLRYAVRQRAARALRDVVLLDHHLDSKDRDRALIFESLFDPELWEGYEEDFVSTGRSDEEIVSHDEIMRSLLSFVLSGFYQEMDNWDLANSAERWLRHSLQQARPDGFADVNVNAFTLDQLNSLESELRDETGNIRTDHDLNDQELGALIGTGRITMAELDKAKPDLNISISESEYNL